MPLINSFRKFGYIALLSAGALYATAAIAGPPILFDGFTVNSGDITPTASSCLDPDGAGPISITCDTASDPSYIVDDGMLQRRVIVSGFTGTFAARNGTYIQFVLTDTGVTGDPAANPFSAGRDNLDFTNEDFIKMNSRVGGIASKQKLIDSDFVTATLENRFVNETNYEFGAWANDLAIIYPWINIVQEISQLDYSLDALNPRQTIGMIADITSNAGGTFDAQTKVVLTQEVDLADPNAPTLGGGAQGFKYVKASGNFQGSSNILDPLLPGGTNGGTVTWSSSELVKALWIGQVIDQASDSGGPQTFGLTKYSADTTGGPPFFLPTTLTSTLVSFSNTTAVNWGTLNVSIFGPAPTLPVMPMIVAPTFAASTPDAIAGTIPAGSAPVGGTMPVPLPVPYYAWTVSGGVFTVDPCPVGAVCGPAIVNEGGVYQRQVTITLTGFTYIQTIVTEDNATGDPNAGSFAFNSLGFKSENFVQMNSTNQGIASILDIEEQSLAYQSVDPGAVGVPLPSDAGLFGYRTELKTGWANGGPLDNRVAIDQRIYVEEPNGFAQTSSFDDRFSMRVGLNQADKRIDLRNMVGTQIENGSGFNFPIDFATSIVTGAFQGTTRTGTLFPTTGAANINWTPYQAVQATWVAAEYPVPAINNAQLDTLSYTNLTTGERVSSTSVGLATPTAPESWGPLPATPLGNPFTQPPPAYATSYTPVVDPFL